MSTKKFRDSELDDGGANASASIKKTLKDIENLLAGLELTPHRNAGLRIELRATLLEALEQVGELWYRKGFNRGHREAYKRAKDTDQIPRILKTSKARRLTASSKKRIIKLSSKIK